MNKRTRMTSSAVRIDPSRPAGSIQDAIDAVEKKGHYVQQYIQLSPFDGILLAHDYPDKKNADDAPTGKPPAPSVVENPEPSDEPSPLEPAPAATENLTTREETTEAPQTDNAPKSKGKRK